MQYSLKKDLQHLKWQQLRSWISFPDCRVATDKLQTQYRLIPKWKWKMLTNYWKFPNRSVQTFGFVYHDTNGQNHGPVWKTQLFFLSGICAVIFWQDCYGKGNLRKSYWNMDGRNSKLGMSLCSSWKRIILICVCGWHIIGWKETKHWSDVETTRQGGRYGRTNIFPGSCVLGLHSTTMPSKQRYCSQLQEHVRIRNLCWSCRKATRYRETWREYSFTVQRHGESCKEMRGKIANLQSRQLASFTKSQYHAPTTINLKKTKMGSVGEMSEVCTQIVLKCLFLARIGRLDIVCSVNKLARAITTLLCIFGSHTFVPISWMCKKQTSVSHSSTESEIVSVDAGLRDGIPALDIWDLVVEVFHSSPNQLDTPTGQVQGNLSRDTTSDIQNETKGPTQHDNFDLNIV